MCGPAAPVQNSLCQDTVKIPPPEIGGTPAPIFGVEVYLEDGGKPASRPEIRYSACTGSMEEHGSSGPCRAVITLKGFREVRRLLNTHGKTVVVMSRIGAEGDAGSLGAVDVRQLKIPAAAHRAYANGEVAAGLEQWPQAENLFREAVRLSPSIALYWDELGCVLERQNKTVEARDAYQKAMAGKPDFVRPYVHLAGLAIMDRDWKQAAALTGLAIRLHPERFPRLYFYDAIASLNLQHVKRAEDSAREAIAADPGHAFPIAEYILGVALLQQGQAAGANHLRSYIEKEPQGPYAASARQSLARIPSP